MDTDAGVRELLKIIFGEKPTIPKKIVAHTSISSSWLNEDFSNRLANVLGVRKYLLIDRWQDIFDSQIRDMLQSHLDYIGYVIYACLCENICNENICDSFISVCALLQQNEMKSCFRKRKDFFRLVNYIRDHKYLNWTLDKSEPTSPDDSTASASQESYLQNLMKELVNYRASKKVSEHEESSAQGTAANLALQVLLTSSAKCPELPSKPEVIERPVACRKNEKVENLTLETSHGDAILNSNSKSAFGEHQENIAQHENIIEAVIRHNRSNNSGNETVNNEIHEKTNRILGRFESKIKSLIEVLDECKEE